MKQLLSSVFAGLILLNVMGYYGVFLGLQYKNARDMRLQFDSGTYDKTLTRVVKIPADGPDSLSSETFQRMDADFEKNGEIYRVIKKRLYRDTFHIVYIKDERGTAIQQTLAKVARTFAAQTADDTQDHKNHRAFFHQRILVQSFYRPAHFVRLAGNDPKGKSLARLYRHIHTRYCPSARTGLITTLLL